MEYLVVGDYFSKFLLVRKIPNTSTHSVIKELGLIKCDNGIKSKCYLFAMCLFLHDAEFKLDLTIGLAHAL